MRIAIDGRGINWYNGSGIGTYTENLLKNLLSIDKSNYYQIYWSGKNYHQYQNENTNLIMCSKKYQRYFQENYFPENIKKEKIDLYHVPQNGIGLNPLTTCKSIVTIHDLIPYIMPETVGRGYLLKFLKEMPYIIEASTGILTVSEYSKKDILKFFPIDPEKIYVTPLAADVKYKPLNKIKCKEYIRGKYGVDKPFLLYIGGFSKRKNVHGLITAFAKVVPHLSKEYNLVIVGSYRDESQDLVKLVSALNMEKHIKFTGFAPDEDMPIYYNACEGFIYPSTYEGFGLPPLEAMSCGTAVITSNTTSIPEVVKDNGLLINPHSDIELQNAMEALICNNSLKEMLQSKALERSSEFSWEKTSRNTLEVYEKIYTSEEKNG